MSSSTIRDIDMPAPLEAQQGLMSSPPRSNGNRKERRNPSITPRKFTRFFTPRGSTSTHASPARQALHEITRPVLNQTPQRPRQPHSTGVEAILDSSPLDFPRDLKRRKVLHTPEHTPDHAYTKEQAFNDLHAANVHSSPCQRIAVASRRNEAEEDLCEAVVPPRRIIPLQDRGLTGQLLQRSHGESMGRLGRECYVYPANDWQDHTANFYTRPEDVHISLNMNGLDRTIPFCTTSCNTNSLVAVGDEEGRVRLLESAKGGKSQFKDIFLSFRVHTNAIIDMTFSDDDTRLATASGDQSARIVDMSTQQTISFLGNHNASLKQVRFQPGSNNHSVVATSSRDGSIQIWDLRCKGYEEPLLQMDAPVDSGRPATRSRTRTLHYGRVVNSIYDAHKPLLRQSAIIEPTDEPGRGEVGGRLGDVSVTAIQFLSSGLDHLLLSASEADSSVKLWDIRCLQTKKRHQIPLSSTQQPQSHNKWRHFGVSSMNLSTDGSRLYTLCKDNTVYAYSTAHLMLGHAPELSTAQQARPGSQKPSQKGLGPLYGFRHAQLHATSFYVKSAIRRAKDGRSELLAVGSSDGCAVLFPTDERYLAQQRSQQEDVEHQVRPSLRRVGSGLGGGRMEDSIPISTNGTPLIRGHDREVGSLAWAHDGELITVGDDFLVRCWREGDDARDLRTGGESQGRRWGCGWADVDERYDAEDE